MEDALFDSARLETIHPHLMNPISIRAVQGVEGLHDYGLLLCLLFLTKISLFSKHKSKS
jgi:hypothetical protein